MTSQNTLARFSRNLWLSVGLVVLLVFSFSFYVWSEKQLDRADKLRFQSFRLASELRQSSDDLTRMVRLYVISGDPVYKQHYQDILDIRNGTKPRPEEYWRIYWDLLLPGGVAPRPESGQAIALLDLMRQAGVTEDEFQKLAEAKANSDALTISEFEAMKLVESTGPEAEARAIRMLHDARYNLDKAAIMKPIDEFFVLVDARTRTAVQSAATHALVLRFVFTTTGLGLIFMLWRTYAAMRDTLGGGVDQVYAHITRIGSGDYSAAIPVKAGRENSVLGWLSATQNQLAANERERKRDEENLQRQQAELRALFDLVPAMIWFKDTNNGILRVNQRVAEAAGKPAAEIEGKPSVEIYPVEAAKFYADDLEVIQSGVAKLGYVEPMRSPDGEEHWVQTDKVPVRGRDGKVTGIVVMAQDITERKRGEVALQESRRFLQSTLDALSAHIAILDESGTILEVNRAWEQFARANHFLGSNYGVGDNYLQLCDAATGDWAEEAPAAAKGIRDVLAGVGEEFQLEYSCPSPREQRWFLLRATRFAGEARVVVAHENITERKRAEYELRESEEKFASLFRNNPGAIVLSRLSDGDVLDVNEGAYRLFGFARDETIGRTVLELNFWADTADRVRYTRELRERGRVTDFETTLCHRSGEIRNALISAELVKLGDETVIIATCTDITERKRAEARLRDSERLYYSLVENLPQHVFRKDLTGRFTFGNVPFCTSLGKPIAEILGKSDFDFCPPQLATKYQRDDQLVLQTGQPFEGEEEHQQAGGGTIFVNVIKTPLRDATGQIIGVQGISWDITERKRLEAQFFQSQKMETVGKLAGGVAHEFNSILTAIIGQSELLLEKLPPGDPLSKNANEIRKAADRAATLTRQLLAYGRKQLLQPESLDLNEVMASMDELFRNLLGPGVDVRIVPDTGLHAVKADAAQIEQVIINLAINARDAMPHGGKLTLETANVTVNPDSVGRHPDLKPGDYVRLTITDTGMGMSEEVRKRAFEPFFTTKGVGSGTGLGLAMCLGIVNQSGGHISVYSELGRGTTFKIYLPQVTPPAQAPAPQLGASDLPRGTETILLVEDDPSLREMAGLLLQRLGYQVLTAANGMQALNLVEQPGQEPIDLLFTDVVMPQLDGKELSDRVHALHPKTKILFASTYMENAIVHQGVLQPGVALLQKPFTPSALARTVRTVLDAPNPSAPAGAGKVSRFTDLTTEGNSTTT